MAVACLQKSQGPQPLGHLYSVLSFQIDGIMSLEKHKTAFCAKTISRVQGLLGLCSRRPGTAAELLLFFASLVESKALLLGSGTQERSVITDPQDLLRDMSLAVLPPPTKACLTLAPAAAYKPDKDSDPPSLWRVTRSKLPPLSSSKAHSTASAVGTRTGTERCHDPQTCFPILIQLEKPAASLPQT